MRGVVGTMRILPSLGIGTPEPTRFNHQDGWLFLGSLVLYRYIFVEFHKLLHLNA
jgi:hypothetical protein